MRKIFFNLLLASLMKMAWAQDGWTVDGVWLGATADRLPHPLKAFDLAPGWSSWMGQRIEVYGVEMVVLCPGEGVVRCQGRELRLASRLLLKSGDSIRRLQTMLGRPDDTSGAMGWCTEDPCYWNHYKRAGAVVSVLVSNDDFIRRKFPKRWWPESLGKVWAVELRRNNFRELLKATRSN